MGQIIGGLLLLGLWGGAACLAKAWARQVKAPFWVARLLAQFIGGGSACALLFSVADQITMGLVVVGAVVAITHGSVIAWLMREEPTDWPHT